MKTAATIDGKIAKNIANSEFYGIIWDTKYVDGRTFYGHY